MSGWWVGLSGVHLGSGTVRGLLGEGGIWKMGECIVDTTAWTVRGTWEAEGREWLLPGPHEKQETVGTLEIGGQVAGARGSRSHCPDGVRTSVTPDSVAGSTPGGPKSASWRHISFAVC